MKKTIVALLALSAMTTSVSFADSLSNGTDPFHNSLYVGAQATGYSVSQGSVYTGPEHYIGQNGNARSSAFGLNGGAYVGYGTDFSNGLYLGGEIGGSMAVTTPKAKRALSYTPPTLLYSPYQFYADFMPGYKISNNILLYAKIGLAANVYKLERYASNGKLHHLTPDQKFGFGYRVGVGVEDALTDHLTLRAGVMYEKISQVKFAQHYYTTGTKSGTTTAKPGYVMANVGVSYRFGL